MLLEKCLETSLAIFTQMQEPAVPRDETAPFPAAHPKSKIVPDDRGDRGRRDDQRERKPPALSQKCTR